MRLIIGLVALTLLELPFAACAQRITQDPRTARVDAILYSARVRVVPGPSRRLVTSASDAV